MELTCDGGIYLFYDYALTFGAAAGLNGGSRSPSNLDGDLRMKES